VDRVTVLDWLATAAAARERAGLVRPLRPRAAADGVLDLASNDYLGLGQHPEVLEAGAAALNRWGAGATGSRLVTGSTELHQEFERALAEFCGAEAALVFSSGYTANIGVLTALADPDTLIVSDASNHASIVDGCRLSRARTVITPHLDVASVDRALATRTQSRALVVTDAVFSTDGDLAPLGALHEVTRRHGALLLIDEAHGLGVRGRGGRGLSDEHGLGAQPDVVRTVTLSKSLGSQGGAVLAGRLVIEHLVNTARSFIFDTGLAPAAAGAALAALQVLRREPQRAVAVLARADRLATMTGAPTPTSAVVSVILGRNDAAVAAAQACLDRGIRVGCFRPPSVPPGTARLRLTARATLTDADLDRVRDVFGQLSLLR
jgi:8-amino-7-oxononanoate synthase